MTLEDMQNASAKALKDIINANTNLHVWRRDPLGHVICKPNQFYISLHGLDHLVTIETQDPR